MPALRLLPTLRCTALLVALVSLLPSSSALANGLALTPPMGWSTWNVFKCDYTEVELRQVADALVASGLAAVGYTSFNIDDCWEAEERTADGQLTYNATKFPSGIKAFGDYLHSLNLTFGLYTSSGPATCQGYPGSWQHEAEDALTFASWGVDYLKLDSCYQFNVSDRARSFTAMSKGLLATKRPIVFSCCTPELILKTHNDEYPIDWAPALCNLARIQWDIADTWPSTLSLLHAAQNQQRAPRPGYWNDLDILTVGQGRQSLVEYTSQFMSWAILSAPLIVGLDVRRMSDTYRALLSNAEAVAINQDRLGEAANLVRRSDDGSAEVWAKALWTNHTQHTASAPSTPTTRHTHAPLLLPVGSSRSAVLAEVGVGAALPVSNFHPWPYHAVWMLNRASVAQDLTLNLLDLHDNYMCPHEPPPNRASIRDAWNGKELGTVDGLFTAKAVPAHGSVLLTVSLVTSSEEQ